MRLGKADLDSSTSALPHGPETPSDRRPRSFPSFLIPSKFCNAMSGTKHPLELLLQSHLGTDAAALLHLPELLHVLEQPDVFGDGPHSGLSAGILGKWNARISSLLHSREASSRWVGLCLARHTSVASRQILVESAQGWVGVVLPMLSASYIAPCRDLPLD